MATSRWFVWVGVAVFAASAWAQTPAEQLDAARQAIAANKFPDALKALDAVANAPNNDTATMLALFELQGIAYTGAKKTAQAKTAFQKLLLLAPATKLQGKQPPKVTQAFNEVKKAVNARVPGGIKLEQLTPEIKENKVVAVLISLENDVMKLGKKARVHLKADGGAWTVAEVDAMEMIRADASGKVVEWWAELLGDKGAVLKTLASEASPLFDKIPSAPAPKSAAPKEAPKETPKDTKVAAKDTKTAPKDAPKAAEPEKKPALTPDASKPPPPEIVEKPGKKTKVPVLPIALAGAAVVAGGTAAFFGVRSNATRTAFNNAAVDANGITTGVTRAQALDMERSAGTDAIVANTLMGAGVALAVGAGVTWFLGREDK